jgi:AraC-like DNA-binding protein
MQPAFSDIVNIGPNCIERFIDNSNAPEINRLDIELAGCSNLSGEYTVGRVAPPNHTLFYSLKGSGVFRTPSGVFSLDEGELIVLPAKQSFEVSISGHSWDIFWLNLSNTATWKSLLRKGAYVIEHASLEGLHHAMELLYLERVSQNREAAIQVVSYYLKSLFTNGAPVDNHEQTQENDKHNAHTKRLTTLFSAVDRQLQFEWNMQHLSEKAHYSAPHLHRLCVKRYGRSPMQHVIFLRMQRAKSLLKGTQWPISYIANYVGYANVFVFSKRFKKSVGVSPTKYREDVT